MSGQPESRDPWSGVETRISDADRERAAERLREALAEGRLEMPEYEERLGLVLRARTAAELLPHLADLPGPPIVSAAPTHKELRTTLSALRRAGRWEVPRRLTVHSRGGTITLDFTEAVLAEPVVELALEVYGGTVKLILPDTATIDVEAVESGMIASSVSVRGIPLAVEPTGRPHVTVSGRMWGSRLTARPKRRFLGMLR